MPRCPNCDHENPDAADRCESCGAPLTEDSADSASGEPDENTELARQIAEALQKGGKIHAIKLYRKATGVGLKEAKDAVEALAARHGIQPKSGCAGVLLLLVVTAATVVLLT